MKLTAPERVTVSLVNAPRPGRSPSSRLLPLATGREGRSSGIAYWPMGLASAARVPSPGGLCA